MAVVGTGATSAIDTRFAPGFSRTARMVGFAAAGVGVIVAVGWIVDLPWLTSLHPSLASMKLNTAVALVLLGAGLAGRAGETSAGSRRHRWLAIAATLIAGATLVEYLLSIDLGIDELVRDDPSSIRNPGRMSPATAGCIVLLGVAIVGLDSRVAEAVALFALLLAHVGVLGYLYGVRDLYAIGPYASVAIHTALSIYALAVGVLLARPRRGLMRVNTSASPGGVLARKLLPPALVVPAVLALLRQWGEHAGWYGTELGRAILVAANTAVSVGLICWAAFGLVRSDEKLRASEARKAAVLDSSLDAIVSMDANGDVLEFTAAAERMFGRRAADVIGTSLADAIIPPAIRSAHQGALARYLRSGVPTVLGRRLELVGMRADGSEFPVEVSIVRVGAGDPPTFTGFIRDLTDAKRARAELDRSHDRLRTLAEVSRVLATVATDYHELLAQIARVTADLIGDGCMVTLLDADGETLVNAANAHRDPAREADYRAFLSGMVVSKTTSASVSAGVIRSGESRLIAEVDPAALVQLVDDALRPAAARLTVHSVAVVPIRIGPTVIGTLSLQRSEAGRSYTRDDLTLLQDLADRAGLAIETARLYDDLDRRVRQRTEELEAVNTELDAFSYSVAHDLRAPLRAIGGFGKLLLDEHAGSLGPDGRDDLERILGATKRMDALIDDLLRLAKVTRAELRRTEVDLTAMVREIISEQTPRRQVRVEVDGHLVVRADRSLLRIAVANLLSNAWKFTAKTSDPVIEVGATLIDGKRVYFVRDNGAGFSMQQARRLFGAFQRLHSDRDFEGTGIGLAIVQRIIHRHGGRIWAEAEEGRGATFRFTLGQ
jgi:PAS domain S-box-containing protein